MNLDRPILSSNYDDAVSVALALQVPIAGICLLLLDFGVMARICAAAMLGFWSLMAWIAATRPWSPTPGDLFYCRWGFVVCFAAAITLGRLVQ